MNNATLNRWLKKLAVQVRSEQQQSPSDRPLRIVKRTGVEFRDMVQSDASFTVNSEYRYVATTIRVDMQYRKANFGEELPLTIPSTKYRSPSWANAGYRFKDEKISPHYTINGNVDLGEGKFNETTKQWISKIYPCGVNINDCNFLSIVSLKYISSDYWIKFTDCQFNNHISISESIIKRLEFQNCTFKYSFTEIFEVKINKLIIKGCEFIDLNINSTVDRFVDSIYIEDIKINILSLYKPNFGTLFLNKTTFNQIKLEPNYGLSSQDCIHHKTIFGGISIKLDVIDTSFYSLKNIRTSYIKINGTLSKSLFLKDVELDRIEIIEFLNEGKLRLHNISLMTLGSVLIADSQLGKAEFNDVNFSNAADFRVYLSNMTEITTTNSIFPFTIKGRSDSDHREVRETFRQLKYAASKQGDRIRELQYEQLEFTTYAKSLKGWKDLGNMIILYTNKVSNNHGQSWEPAALWLILITTLLFIGISTSMGYNIV